MGTNVFDRVARDYERIHNRSLPPGVRSDEFVAQKAAYVAGWIADGYRGGEFCYLDFGCGNGRLFKSLAESAALGPWVGQGRLRLFGFDTSPQSIQEANAISAPHPVCLVTDLNDLPPGLRFDLVISCNVFHHIPPGERDAAARSLRGRMKPGARLVIWEHNPYNPFTRLIVKACPFDKDARLLTCGVTRALFEAHSFRRVRQAHVNVFPPRWQRLAPVSIIETKLMPHPVGAQYWMMFEAYE